jgi:D-beta-D-heptose 7-phosphate kinase/D-beta-D-heptose 1-phosphate adenosyltransferase
VIALEPDVLVKGADWREGTIVGADVVEARGGQVVRIALAEGYSTTKLIERIKR